MMNIQSPLKTDVITTLKAGDEVLLSGTIYTARDVAHKRFVDLLERGRSLPLDLDGQIIYYTGPSPAKPGDLIGSAGPTTSYRMDQFSPLLLRQCGLKAMIGKGNRNDDVVNAQKKHKAVYFGAIGGAAALMAKAVKTAEVVAYEDLGPEAIRRLEVENFPVVVVNDCHGGDLYKEGMKKYQK